jgi:hypothetical protein
LPAKTNVKKEDPSMNRAELDAYLNSTVEEAFGQYYSRQMGVPYDKKQTANRTTSILTKEQKEDWDTAINVLADVFEGAVRDVDLDRDERDI